MSGAELIALAERVEAATGPDRELDALIAPLGGLRVVNEGHPLGLCCYDTNGLLHVLPAYTRRLDAAMSLYVTIPERVPSNPRLATAEALRCRAALKESSQ